ncbi:unnamed protein product [Linum trigynum]|uniref:Uncharacterized protein n=1 Tax=Linum trigynum TaxID=586398 RepID=A0AAV2D9E7_9ROSI
MNAANSLASSVSLEDHSNHAGSDSDTSIDEVPEYYQPISHADENDEEEEDESADHANHAPNSGILENGHCFAHEAQSWISSLHLNGVKTDEDDENQVVEEEGEMEMVVAESSNSSVVQAFREDENRRNAPLTPENATRVMEAMRGISFVGSAPDWAGEIPETQWIDRLRRIRQMPQP